MFFRMRVSLIYVAALRRGGYVIYHVEASIALFWSRAAVRQVFKLFCRERVLLKYSTYVEPILIKGVNKIK